MVDKKPDIKKEEEKSTVKSQTLGFSSPRLELKKTLGVSGSARQPFSHGRNKSVSVEVKKVRTYKPFTVKKDSDGPFNDGKDMGLSDLEKEARLNALNNSIKVKEEIKNKVSKELIEEEGTPDLKLRVFVSGGGCSGFQYGFTFEESINDDDTKVVKDSVTLLIDPMSLQYLTGAEIDYQDNVQGSQFVIKNPQATSTCGCGSSFST